jgi:phosphohistidine phosphatase SixA
VQHGEAKPSARDPDRSLRKQGRKDVSGVAAFAREAGVEVYQIRHSGKRRAEETALILAECLEPEAGLWVCWSPEMDSAPWFASKEGASSAWSATLAPGTGRCSGS